MMRVGILGGGQLGQMIGLAGIPLGCQFSFYDPTPDAPARHCGVLTTANFTDKKALEGFARDADIVTFEFENVPLESVDFLLKHVQVYPGRAALECAQDRLVEKQLFHKLGLRTPDFHPFQNREQLEAIVQKTALPLVLKTRRMGYDGKGQFLLRETVQIEEACEALGDVPSITEAFIPFQRELSIIGYRTHHGEIGFYPLVENVHESGILRLSRAPALNVSPELEESARNMCRALLNELNYIGVLALELFEVNGQLVANEFAPRVHNSGHWTIEGASMSQFELHLRAILGFPIPAEIEVRPSFMINAIGELPKIDQVLRISGSHYHSYLKAPKPGRKVGHTTIVCDSQQALDQKLAEVSGLLTPQLQQRFVRH